MFALSPYARTFTPAARAKTGEMYRPQTTGIPLPTMGPQTTGIPLPTMGPLMGPSMMGPSMMGPLMGPLRMGPQTTGIPLPTMGPLMGPPWMGPQTVVPSMMVPSMMGPSMMGPLMGPLRMGPQTTGIPLPMMGPQTMGPLMGPLRMGPQTTGILMMGPPWMGPQTVVPSTRGPSKRNRRNRGKRQNRRKKPYQISEDLPSDEVELSSKAEPQEGAYQIPKGVFIPEEDAVDLSMIFMVDELVTESKVPSNVLGNITNQDEPASKGTQFVNGTLYGMKDSMKNWLLPWFIPCK